MDSTDKPPHKSKKFLAYVLTLASVLAGAALKLDEVAVRSLAEACMLGLPVVLGGQAWIDRERAKQPAVTK